MHKKCTRQNSRTLSWYWLSVCHHATGWCMLYKPPTIDETTVSRRYVRYDAISALELTTARVSLNSLIDLNFFRGRLFTRYTDNRLPSRIGTARRRHCRRRRCQLWNIDAAMLTLGIAPKWASDECGVVTPDIGLNGCDPGGTPDPVPGCGVGGDGNPASP